MGSVACNRPPRSERSRQKSRLPDLAGATERGQGARRDDRHGTVRQRVRIWQLIATVISLGPKLTVAGKPARLADGKINWQRNQRNCLRRNQRRDRCQIINKPSNSAVVASNACNSARRHNAQLVAVAAVEAVVVEVAKRSRILTLVRGHLHERRWRNLAPERIRR